MASDNESANDFNREMGRGEVKFEISAAQRQALELLVSDCHAAEGIIVAQTSMVVDVLKRDRERVQQLFQIESTI